LRRLTLERRPSRAGGDRLVIGEGDQYERGGQRAGSIIGSSDAAQVGARQKIKTGEWKLVGNHPLDHYMRR
jgi:hypothetical protein